MGDHHEFHGVFRGFGVMSARVAVMAARSTSHFLSAEICVDVRVKWKGAEMAEYLAWNSDHLGLGHGSGGFVGADTARVKVTAVWSERGAQSLETSIPIGGKRAARVWEIQMRSMVDGGSTLAWSNLVGTKGWLRRYRPCAVAQVTRSKDPAVELKSGLFAALWSHNGRCMLKSPPIMVGCDSSRDKRSCSG